MPEPASSKPAAAPEADRFSVPPGWRLDRTPGPVTLSGPEGDVSISLVEREWAGTAQEIAAAAWKIIDPAFASKVAREAKLPPPDGWDEMGQIVYEVPASEGRIELAIMRKLGQRAYVNLVRGTTAGISRRGAQLQEVVTSWKPAGLRETSLKSGPVQPWSEAHSTKLREFVRSAIETMRVPGVAVAVVQSGKVAYAEGFGVRSVESREPVTPQSRFMIGSTTKPLTTLLMAQLVDRGKMQWSTPIVDLLKDFTLADAALTAQLQMRHTASASTGMPRQDMEFVFGPSGLTGEDRMAQMKNMRPTTGLGETFQYSNFLVAAGGFAAARAYSKEGTLEQAYDAALRDLVLTPLHMNDTFTHHDDALKGNAAMPHAIDFEGMPNPVPLPIACELESVGPAGGAWSTVMDLAQYVLLELGKGRMPGGESVISEAALLERRKKGIRVDEKSSYGLGLILSEYAGLPVIHHGGNTMGHTADMFFLPESDLGIVVLTNLYAANGFTGALREKFFELMFGAEAKAERTVANMAKLVAEGIAIFHQKITSGEASAEWAGQLIGRFECPELSPAEISRRDGGYWIQFGVWGSQLGTENEPAGGRNLRLISPPWRGTVKLAVDLEKRTFTLDGGQIKYTYKPAD
jgi:CubicO group peptidase (beta-lactamase class C family)